LSPMLTSIEIQLWRKANFSNGVVVCSSLSLLELYKICDGFIIKIIMLSKLALGTCPLCIGLLDTFKMEKACTSETSEIQSISKMCKGS
jgi:hypothetical protein